MRTFRVIPILIGIWIVLCSIAFAGISKGPYLQSPTADSISILWETEQASLDTLEWGPTADLGSSTSDAVATRFHEHRVTGLDVQTLYQYRVTSGGQPGGTYSFNTAADVCSPVTFATIGDTRSNHISHRLNADKLFAAGPDFVINTGDIVDHGDSDFENELVWQMHFNDERELMREVPLYPAFGNHDTDTEAIWQRIFALPDAASGSEFYYSFNYGNSLFVVVNTQVNYIAGSVQHTWLDQTLAAGQADPNVLHIFVAFHVPPYAAGDHGNSIAVINNLVPLFETYGVQAVLNGHEHNFQHIENGGVRYFVIGGGAASLDRQERTFPELIQFNYRHHYTLIHVDGATVTFEAYDTFTNAKFYTITWTDDMGKDPCANIDDDDDDNDTDDDDVNSDDDDSDDDDSDDDDDDDDNDDDLISGDTADNSDNNDETSCCG
jgi:hypothetical protein